ncbi:hypothetical protein G9A89_017813 [Geosiphon pyriformis]|nr:hypothetical protein G9A89_017813 [Geosiphon pyriformis]
MNSSYKEVRFLPLRSANPETPGIDLNASRQSILLSRLEEPNIAEFLSLRLRERKASLNELILFRNKLVMELQRLGLNYKQKDLSSLASRYWQDLNEYTKDKYRTLAARIATEHLRIPYLPQEILQLPAFHVTTFDLYISYGILNFSPIESEFLSPLDLLIQTRYF